MTRDIYPLPGAILKKWTEKAESGRIKTTTKQKNGRTRKVGVKGQKQADYDENFKKTIANLNQKGKSQSQLSREYGIGISSINRWIKK